MWKTWVQSWVGKISWRREPTPVFWPGEFHGLCSPWDCKKSDNWVTFTSLHTLWSAFTILSIFYSCKKFVLKLSLSPRFLINPLVRHACWYNSFLSYEIVFICLSWNILVSLIWKISLQPQPPNTCPHCPWGSTQMAPLIVTIVFMLLSYHLPSWWG